MNHASLAAGKFSLNLPVPAKASAFNPTVVLRRAKQTATRFLARIGLYSAPVIISAECLPAAEAAADAVLTF